MSVPEDQIQAALGGMPEGALMGDGGGEEEGEVVFPGGQSVTLAAFTEYWAELSEEERENFQASVFGETEMAGDILALQSEEANALRDTAGVSNNQSGRLAASDNPMQHLAVGLNRYKGQRDSAAAMEGLQGLQQQQAEALRHLGAATNPLMR